VIMAMQEKRCRNIRRKRRKATASRPILSTSSGSLVLIKGGIQPKRLSDIRGGCLLPTWYLTLGSYITWSAKVMWLGCGTWD
jgi:hypothetical protein